MPYKSRADLHERFKQILSPDAQDIFVEAFNYAWYNKGLPEVRCFMYAWSVLKRRGYEKNAITGVWEKIL